MQASLQRECEVKLSVARGVALEIGHVDLGQHNQLRTSRSGRVESGVIVGVIAYPSGGWEWSVCR